MNQNDFLNITVRELLEHLRDNGSDELVAKFTGKDSEVMVVKFSYSVMEEENDTEV